MKAIILAAGKATRLLPLTKNTPQCLLEVNKQTILEYQIKLLRNASIQDVSVITGFCANKVEKFCQKKKIKTIFNPFYNVSGMALTLWIAKEELKEGFIFLYSDVLFDSNIISDLVKQKGDVCLAVKKNDLREEAEKVIEKNGLVERITKEDIKGENGEFIGIAKFSKEGMQKLMTMLDKIAKKDIKTSFIDVIDNLIMSGQKVTAHDIKNKRFVDIDFPDDIKKARKTFKD